MATLSVGGTTVFDGSALQSGVTGDVSGVTTFPAGMVIQTLNDVQVNTQAFTSSTFTDSRLIIPITPKRTGSKMLLMTDVKVSWNIGVSQAGMKITRHPAGGSEVDVKVGTVTSGNQIPVNGHFYIGLQGGMIPMTSILLDELTVTKDVVITYTVQISSLNNAGTIYINRGDAFTDDSSIGCPTSSLTVMEVAQ